MTRDVVVDDEAAHRALLARRRRPAAPSSSQGKARQPWSDCHRDLERVRRVRRLRRSNEAPTRTNPPNKNVFELGRRGAGRRRRFVDDPRRGARPPFLSHISLLLVHKNSHHQQNHLHPSLSTLSTACKRPNVGSATRSNATDKPPSVFLPSRPASVIKPAADARGA